MSTIIFADPHIIGETIGGAEVQLWMLARGFCEAGWDVHYVTDAALSETQREGVILHSLAGFESERHKEKFFSTLCSINPDVIYQRGRKSYTGLAGQYAEENNTPLIFSTSMDVDCQRYKDIGRLFQRPEELIRKLRILPHRFKRDITSLRGMRQATLILTQSNLQKDLLRKNLALESRVFRNLHPVPDKEGIKKSEPGTVLWLASVKRWKRPELFIELAESLRRNNYRFVLAGRLADRKEYADLLASYTKKNPNFQYIENVDLDESNRLIAKASIFINTSEPFEGFPNTFIQSWLRNTVTLSLNVDPDGLIRKKNIGRLSGDLSTMSNQVIELMEDDRLRREMGSNARNFAIEKFGYSNNFNKIETLARDLVQEKD